MSRKIGKKTLYRFLTEFKLVFIILFIQCLLFKRKIPPRPPLFLHSWNYCRTAWRKNWFWKLVSKLVWKLVSLKSKILLPSSSCLCAMKAQAPVAVSMAVLPHFDSQHPRWHKGEGHLIGSCRDFCDMKCVGQYNGTTNQTWLSLRSLNPSLNPQAMNLQQD